MPEFWKAAEKKVKSAAVASFAVSILLAIINATVGNSEVLGHWPAWIQFIVVTAGPPVAAFLAGYLTRHPLPGASLTFDEKDRLARLAYQAYGQVTGNKNFQGAPMPAWDDLGSTIQAAWRAGTAAVAGGVIR
jgi:hypothetical protein